MVEWTLNPLVAIGIGIAVMFFGYAFGLIEGRGKGYKKRQEEEAESKKHTPLVVEMLPPASPVAISDETPVLDVSMAPDGGLRLKMDGQRTDTSTLDAKQRQRLIAILNQMRPWLEASKSASSPAQPQPVSSPQGASSSKGVSSPQGGVSPSKASAPVSVPAPVLATDERPTAPPPPEDDDDDEPAPTPGSIVAQINSVLQARLAGTPLKDKGIRLQESLDGGVLVWVGVSKYESIEAVPDEQVQAAIRAAIIEWEDKYTPGL